MDFTLGAVIGGLAGFAVRALVWENLMATLAERKRVSAEWRRQVLAHHFEGDDYELDHALDGGCPECGKDPTL